jgi:hypothetical protein
MMKLLFVHCFTMIMQTVLFCHLYPPYYKWHTIFSCTTLKKKKKIFSVFSWNTHFSSNFLSISDTAMGMNFHKIKNIPHSLYFSSVDARKSQSLLNNQMFIQHKCLLW